MSKNKIVVFCLDALCTSDLQYMNTLPNFKLMLDNGALVKHVEPVYPTLTYPCHCSIVTGNTVKVHRVAHNEMVEVENPKAPWYTLKSQVKCPTVLDLAREHGLTTASITWPVSGGADYTYNLPMIVPIAYAGNDARPFYENNATQELIDRYFWKYGHYLAGEEKDLDEFTMSVSLDLLQDYGQPDVMLVKMCDLDTAKHCSGIDAEEVKSQLRKHDRQLGQLMEAVKRFGDYEHTNFIILGDHGQANIKRHINFNLLLKKHGFIETDENNNLISWKAYCHSASMSAWIELYDKHDQQLHDEVYKFLCELAKDPQYNIETVFTAKEVSEQYGLENEHIDFVLEPKEPMSFDSTLSGKDLFEEYLKPGWHHSVASHGYLPSKDETTTFFGMGPNFIKNAYIERSTMLNEAPTMASILGFDMTCEGTSWKELLK